MSKFSVDCKMSQEIFERSDFQVGIGDFIEGALRNNARGVRVILEIFNESCCWRFVRDR